MQLHFMNYVLAWRRMHLPRDVVWKVLLTALSRVNAKVISPVQTKKRGLFRKKVLMRADGYKTIFDG